MPCDTLAPPIEVLLVDDQRAILAGVTALIESESPRMRVAGHAQCSRDALQLAHNLQPHIVVLDVDLGGEDGLALIPHLRGCCDATIIVFTCLAATHVRQRASNLGAAGVVLKTASGEELIAAILRAME